MENWPIYLVSLLVHILMFLSVGYEVETCQVRTVPEKLRLILLALLVPIFGPIIVHNILKRYVKHRGQWVDVNGGSNIGSSSSSDSATASDSDGGSGGGGD